MGFATEWLEKRVLFPVLIDEPPDNQTGIIVVVPSFNEPGISFLLDSLGCCEDPGCKVEVIVLVNAPADAGNECILNNRICINNINSWKKRNRSFFRLYAIDAGQPEIRGWGVGLARKTGMDEALRRFNAINRPEGVIASLDADCTVECNYFAALYNELLVKKQLNGCSVYFEHSLKGADLTEKIFRNIILYELHMRYYLQGLNYSGFPYAFHTVGSCIAVKASKYLLCGGMNRRQAGEDFYFIQKLVPLGGYFALNKTTVYPSPRESSRVPFGTGPVISKLLEKPAEMLLTYNLRAFNELRILFGSVPRLFQERNNDLIKFYKTLPPGLKSFVAEEEWIKHVTDIRNNTSGCASFTKRFFTWFNMFRIVKFMNFVHKGLFEKQPVNEAAFFLLEKLGKTIKSQDPSDLLIFYREMEKNEL